MNKTTTEQRWAIAPPASEESSNLSGQVPVENRSERRDPARQFQVERPTAHPLSSGFALVRPGESLEELKITEVPPPHSGAREVRSAEYAYDPVADTIPAPQWLGDED